MPVESKTVISESEVRPGLRACDHLADLTGDVAFGDQSLGERDVDLAVRAALADVVDEDPGPLEDARVEFLIAALVGADRGDVRPGRDPLVQTIGPRAGVIVTTTSAPRDDVGEVRSRPGARSAKRRLQRSAK